MLLYIRLQMPRSRLPIIGRVADTARQKDELVRIWRWKHEILGMTPHHAKPIDQHPDKEIGLSQILTRQALRVIRSKL